jgi:hypothetical protein
MDIRPRLFNTWAKVSASIASVESCTVSVAMVRFSKKIFSKVLTRRKPMSIIERKKEKEKKMTTLILIVVGKKYKVYKDMGNGKRRLLGSFNSSHEAERFMNA